MDAVLRATIEDQLATALAPRLREYLRHDGTRWQVWHPLRGWESDLGGCVRRRLLYREAANLYTGGMNLPTDEVIDGLRNVTRADAFLRRLRGPLRSGESYPPLVPDAEETDTPTPSLDGPPAPGSAPARPPSVPLDQPDPDPGCSTPVDQGGTLSPTDPAP